MIKKILFLLIIITLPLAAQESKETYITIYNEGLGLVKEVREFDLQKGISEIKVIDVPEKIDPVTVKIDFNGQVLEQNYRYDLVNLQKILSKYIDKQITLTNEGESISGSLLSAGYNNQFVIKKTDGSLMMIPDIEDYQIGVDDLPAGLITRPTLVWSLNAAKPGRQDIGFGYQTGGLQWKAEYVAELNETDDKMSLSAWVDLDNSSGKSYRDATLKLVAGDISRSRNYDLRGYAENVDYLKGGYSAEYNDNIGRVEEKSFYEYHLYEVKRPVTLTNNEKKQISLFSASGIDVEKEYIYHSRGNNIEMQTPQVVIKFNNSKENNMGMPIPEGVVRINKADGKSSVLVGENYIKHTPKGEEIKITTGNAFDIIIDETIASQKKISDKVHDTTYEVEIRNRKDSDISVIVHRHLWGVWEVMDSNIPHSTENAKNIKFEVPVKAGETVKLTYVIRHS